MGDAGKGELDLDHMMERFFWKDILKEITSDMSPWDINILELANRYSRKVEKMKELNFKVPANVVLVSSILLRMKSDLLEFSGPDLEYDLEEWMKEGDFLEEFSQFSPEEPQPVDVNIEPEIPIKVKPRRVPKRRITATELISAIEEVVEEKKIEEKREKQEEKIVVESELDWKRKIHETYLRVMEILMRKERALFSELAKGKREKIVTLLSLLHLSSSKKIKLSQEKLYEEIFIHPCSSKDNS